LGKELIVVLVVFRSTFVFTLPDEPKEGKIFVFVRDTFERMREESMQSRDDDCSLPFFRFLPTFRAPWSFDEIVNYPGHCRQCIQRPVSLLLLVGLSIYLCLNNSKS
jgi:hypothetical protein